MFTRESILKEALKNIYGVFVGGKWLDAKRIKKTKQEVQERAKTLECSRKLESFHDH